jgi:hypothetical protein
MVWGSRFEAEFDQTPEGTLILTGIVSLARCLFQSYVMLAFWLSMPHYASKQNRMVLQKNRAPDCSEARNNARYPPALLPWLSIVVDPLSACLYRMRERTFVLRSG